MDPRYIQLKERPILLIYSQTLCQPMEGVMQIFCVLYSGYDNETNLIGAFSSEEKAQVAINDAISADKALYPNYPSRYQQREFYYAIIEKELDEAF